MHHDFKKGSHPRNNIVHDEKGDLITDSHSILANWRIHFSQLFNGHGVNDVRQIDRLCGLVVRVSGYRYRGLGFDSRRYQIF